MYGDKVHVISGTQFFPRGGSAHVVRALATDLPERGWDVTVLSGSLGSGLGDAREFYSGLEVRAVDFDAGDAPMHPSYEDRTGAPDRCFAMIGDREYCEHVHAWSRALEGAGAGEADVLHLHHLTPMNEAAARVAPSVPVIGHLHGTELMMLERIAAGPPSHWLHAEAWATRMRRWADRCSSLIVHTIEEVAVAGALLEVGADRFAVVPNGFDPELFKPASIDRGTFWRERLARSPRGWKPGRAEGSVAYSEAEAGSLGEAVVLVAVGRFTGVKRLGLLIRAFGDAQRAAKRPAALVLVGGHPGEWEGEHPFGAVETTGVENVFLAGWQDHAELPAFFNAADVQVLASVHEQFGLVLVEGMGCALPPIAVDRFGPKAIVEPGRTGWLVPPDDRGALAGAMVEAIDGGEERAARGIAGRRAALDLWTWPAIAKDIATLFGNAASRTADDSGRSGGSVRGGGLRIDHEIPLADQEQSTDRADQGDRRGDVEERVQSAHESVLSDRL